MDKKGINNPNWKGGISKKKFICEVCGKEFTGHHSRTARFCSIKCKAKYQKTLKREKNPVWTKGIREKKCKGCGKTFKWKAPKPYSTFLKQKFCSKECSIKYQIYLRGKDSPNWKGGISKRDMGKQSKWSKRIFERDNYTCQKCGKRGGYLQAHHIKGYTKYPKLRWKLSNGITLCRECHYKTYKFHGNQFTAIKEKGSELLENPNKDNQQLS